MKIKTALFVILLTVMAMNLIACSPSAYSQEADKVEDAQATLTDNQPIHTYDTSPERDMVQRSYDARMAGKTTWNYRIDSRDGFPLWSCVGYGLPIPYATQLTNPEALAYSSYESATLPQPEPNGLYTPDDAAATLVPCLNADGSISPVYEEHPVSSYFAPQCFNEIQRTDGSWSGKYEQTTCGETSFSYLVGSE